MSIIPNAERKTLILTGASRGIGHATVKRFASAGWRVITCSRHGFPENCPWEAGPDDHIQVDLANAEDTRKAIGEMRERLKAQDSRLNALVNVFALHSLVLTLSVAWQAYVQAAPHLYVTAAIALVFKAIIIPVALHRIIVRLGIHREIEKVVGVGTAMLIGMGLVALSMVVMVRVTEGADPLARSSSAIRPRANTIGAKKFT